MTVSGTITLYLYTRSHNTRILDRKVYCSCQHRKEIVNKWSTDYDKVFSQCYFQIAPGTHQSDTKRVWRNIRRKESIYD